jgi:O-antigen/teichoic acid export membrane protein
VSLVDTHRGLGNRILSAYSTSLLGVISGLLTNFWVLREITRTVDAGIFGVYALVLQVTNYLTILQLGLDFAASQKIAECVGRDNVHGANSAYWEKARFNRWAGAIATLLVVVITAVLWSGVGTKSVTKAHLAAMIALFTGATQVLNFLTRRYSAALIGTQFQDIVNLATVGKTIATALLAYVFLRTGMGILCIPVAAFIFSVLCMALLGWQTKRRCPWLRSEPKEHDSAMLKSLMGFGGITTIGGIAWTIEATSDVFILGAYQGSAMVAMYVLWWRFPAMIFDACTRLATSAFPGFAQRHATSLEDARRLLNKLGQISLGLATLALVGISLWLPAFMRVWLGQAYAMKEGTAIALGFATLVSLRIFGNLFGMFWMASGNANVPTALACAQAVVKIGLGLALVKTHGMLGLVIASCAASALQAGGLGLMLYRRQFVVSEFARNAAVLSGLAVIVTLVTYRLPVAVSPPTLIGGIVVTTLLWGSLWLAFAWCSELKPSLQRLLFQRA